MINYGVKSFHQVRNLAKKQSNEVFKQNKLIIQHQ